MPLVKVTDINDNTRMGVWHIREDREFFLDNLKSRLIDLAPPKVDGESYRFLEYLASRHLIQELANENGGLVLNKDEFGKPFVMNIPYHLSLSHTKDYAAVIVSKKHNVGIDIETVHPRVEKVADKFLNMDERTTLNGHTSIKALTLCWSAKESIYKLYGKKSLRFKEHIHLEHPSTADEGNFMGYLHKSDYKRSFKVQHEMVADNVLTYIVDEAS